MSINIDQKMRGIYMELLSLQSIAQNQKTMIGELINVLREGDDLVPRISEDDPMSPALAVWWKKIRSISFNTQSHDIPMIEGETGIKVYAGFLNSLYREICTFENFNPNLRATLAQLVDAVGVAVPVFAIIPKAEGK